MPPLIVILVWVNFTLDIVVLAFVLYHGCYRVLTGHWLYMHREDVEDLARRGLERQRQTERIAAAMVEFQTGLALRAIADAQTAREDAAALQHLAYVVADTIGFPQTEHKRLRRILIALKPWIDRMLAEDLKTHPKGGTMIVHLDKAAGEALKAARTSMRETKPDASYSDTVTSMLLMAEVLTRSPLLYLVLVESGMPQKEALGFATRARVAVQNSDSVARAKEDRL